MVRSKFPSTNPGLSHLSRSFIVSNTNRLLFPGTLCTAILSGILTSLQDQPSDEDVPAQIPTRIIACVTRAASAKRVHDALSPLTSNLTVLQNENLRGMREADVVLLGCKPYQLGKVLECNVDVHKALSGKLLISILGGVTMTQIHETLYKTSDVKIYEEACHVVRVMPNTAALIRESMTVIATSDPPLPPHLEELVRWMFTRVGQVVQLPPEKMDACTALCGSGPAMASLVLEAMADGGLAMGIPRAEAQLMAAQAMKGCAGLVLNGEHPAVLRDKVSTPGGCTIGGLLVLEEGAVRGHVARSIREATVVASQLGKGTQGVNGTRFFPQ